MSTWTGPKCGLIDTNTVKTVGPVKVSSRAGPVVGRTLTRYQLTIPRPKLKWAYFVGTTVTPSRARLLWLALVAGFATYLLVRHLVAFYLHTSDSLVPTLLLSTYLLLFLPTHLPTYLPTGCGTEVEPNMNPNGLIGVHPQTGSYNEWGSNGWWCTIGGYWFAPVIHNP